MQRLFHEIPGNDPVRPVRTGCQGGRCFQAVQGCPGIPVRRQDQAVNGFGIDGQMQLSQAPVPVADRPFQDQPQIIFRERFQHKHAAPGEQRCDDLERGVFRGGADQGDQAAFHMGEKSVLLGLVETVDFIDEKDGP